MFIYEKNNSLNLTFNGSIPVENPEVELCGFENGVKLIVNGTTVVDVTDAKEFKGHAKILAFQKDGVLNVTFKGIDGMSSPEVVIDEVNPYSIIDGVETAGKVLVTVNGIDCTLTYTLDSVKVEETNTTVEENSTPDPVIPEKPVETEDPEEVVEE